uniref:Uncharacterized protein n=1 Tax=Oryza punctata TaxID=4537 RepID=A0A0E0LTE6_ORYPU
MHNQKYAPREQPSVICFNCLESGHRLNNYPLSRSTKAVRRCSTMGRQIIYTKGIVKGRIVPPATASNQRNQYQQGKQCQENNSSPQLQRDSTLLQQCPRQVSPTQVHKTAIKFINTPCCKNNYN